MSYIEVTIGASSSGKSTYAKEEVKKSRGMLIEVNRDNTRRSLFAINGWGEYKFNKDREDLVTSVQMSTIHQVLAAGKSVIVSDTNLNPAYRENLRSIAESHNNVDYKEVWFNVPLEELLARNKTRGSWKLTPERVEQMYNSFVEQYDDTKRTYVPDYAADAWVYEPDTSLPNAVMFDTDGTTATMNGRGPFDWAKVGTDLPKYNVINHAIDLKARGIKVINLSGRDGCCKEATAEWYKKVGMPCDAHFQREAGDQRSDDVIKEEIFRRDIAPFFNVLYAVDDRDRVVDKWRQMGVECWQVASGAF